MFRSYWLALTGMAIVFQVSSGAQSGPGGVKRVQKISHTQGGRVGPLDDEDQLGRAVANLGDLDGNGVVDLAASGHADDDGGIDQGAVYVYLLRADGQVLRTQKISALAGAFTGALDPGDQFGRSVASLGDLDGDGVPDLAVGANYDDDGGMNRGAVWILAMNRDGTVKRTTKISSTQGGFVGPLRNQDEFGRSVASPGDLDGDGIPELAVGSPTDNTGGTRRGAVWMLFLNREGGVRRSLKIASGMGGFTGRLRSLDWFGFSLSPLGDFDRDGVRDLVVGAALDDDGAVNAGAVWLLFLKPDGTVKTQQKISALSGGFTGLLESPDQFGTSVATLGDLNGDGITELAVGAVKDGDGGKENGAAYVLFLTANGTVAFHQKISDTEGDFPYTLDDWDWLASSMVGLGDLDRDGVPDLAIGARNDDDGGPNRGALYLTFLKGSQALTATERGADAPLHDQGARSAGDAPRGSVAAHGRHAEPEGSLELIAGEPMPGSTLVFRLRVPEPFVASGAQARLFLARSRAQLSFAERTGTLLDPSTILGMLEAAAIPGQGQLELALAIPDDPALGGESVAVQALWIVSGRSELSDALELELD